MSRSYRKPILKQKNCSYVKQLYRKRNRRKLKDLNYILNKGDFNKSTEYYSICDWNFGEIKENHHITEYIKFYKIRNK